MEPITQITPFQKTRAMEKVDHPARRRPARQEAIDPKQGKPAFQIMSDLHLEIPQTEQNMPVIPAKAPYLALLGDIGYPHTESYKKFLHSLEKKFEKIFIITGNHEYYSGINVETIDSLIEHFCQKEAKFIFLNRTRAQIQGYRVIGCTLWSNIPEESIDIIARGINDYKLIKTVGQKITPEITNNWHKRDVAWLSQEIKEAKLKNEKVIIMTHHAPTLQNSSSPKHQNSPINRAFATDLEHLLGDPVILWMYGHTHHCSDQVIRGTRLVSNQLGYLQLGEKLDFYPEKIIKC